MLIASGVDILAVSRRLGHRRASTTLDVYGHVLDGGDEAAAKAIEGGAEMMKTYVMEVDGKAAAAFRAKDDEDAAAWIVDWPSMARTWGHNCQGQKLSVRLATIPEQERWRSASVAHTEDDPDYPFIDGLVVSLGEEEQGVPK
jgi:hypothetical protein